MDEPPRKRMVRPPTGGGDGRAPVQRLKTAKLRTPSSQAWLERQLNDPYVAEAKAKGYRSRAAFKLVEIDARAHLLRRGQRVIDLGCAPGGWLQVLAERGAGAVVGIDLLAVDPLPPATIVQGDFTEPGCGDRLAALLGGPPDLILSDMAPNTTGHRQTDHLRIVGLIEAAAEFAEAALKPGGAFIAKAFQGGETAGILASLRRAFADVRTVKPKASRAESSEVYLVATGFRGRAV
ncbi:MAG TPA: RlmE family RNA methyltransferase [Caulobacteraceae bacterium]|jgi:23S rRNA (uridine2552-2'-O)-methyltransferase|nr:RlmE family RNA methyltransferase [Caulobacteraceae bacterium]